MSLPEAVRKQVEEAEELAKKMQAQSEEEEPIEEEVSESEELLEEEKPQREPVEDWEHKYKVLQGKYNAEVPRLHEEIRSLRQANALFEERVKLLEQLVQQKAAAREEHEPEDDAIKTLKEDFPDIYKAVVKLLDQKKHELTTEVEQKITPTTQQLVQQAFYSQLNQLVPDWQELNTDEGFLQWLQQREPFARKTRHELLQEAYHAADAETVAQFFKTYKDQISDRKPQVQNVVPPAGKGRSYSGKEPERKWKQSEIERFYLDAALGKISAKDKERTEREILRAMKEGRISYGV